MTDRVAELKQYIDKQMDRTAKVRPEPTNKIGASVLNAGVLHALLGGQDPNRPVVSSDVEGDQANIRGPQISAVYSDFITGVVFTLASLPQADRLMISDYIRTGGKTGG